MDCVKQFPFMELLRLSDSPFLAFVILVAITHAFYLRFLAHISPTLKSGSIVMAISAFALYCLRHLEFPHFFLIYVALEVIIINFYLGVLVIQGILENKISVYEPTEAFALGVWVTSTALTVLLINQAEKTLLGFVALLSIISFLLFIYFIWVLFYWLRSYWSGHILYHVDGTILNICICIQAMVLLSNELFNDSITPEIYLAIVPAGLVFYLIGVFCMHVRHWTNAHTLLYGALGITALAMVITDVFPTALVMSMWYLTIIVFCVVELINILRIIFMIKMKKPFSLVYDNSQWFRVFSCSILYGLTHAYFEYDYSHDVLVSAIYFNGQYLIALLMAAEVILLTKHLYLKKMELKHEV